MKVEEHGHTIIIKDTQGDASGFLHKVTQEYKTFAGHNLILDLSHDKSIDMNNITAFGPLAKKHKAAKKSFVLVAPELDYNSVPAFIVIVPYLLEAHDIIEMDEIERDLGF